MKKTQTVAVVGFGYWGQKLAQASQAAGLRVVVVDAVSHAGAEYPQKTWAAVLADVAVSGVIIATPEKTHAELVLAALNAQKAVLVEKPATTTSESWAACVALATKNNVPLMVDYTFLHSQAFELWRDLERKYAAQIGALKKLTTVRKAQLTPERIAGKALPIWWDVVIHDLYLLRAAYAAVPTDWKITSAELPSQIKTTARFNDTRFIADYSWLAEKPVRSWLAEYEHGSLLWQRVPNGECFEVTIQGKRVFTTTIVDQNPSPLDTLIKSWLSLWTEKNLPKMQEKHWQEVTQDIVTLMRVSDSLTAQVATR